MPTELMLIKTGNQTLAPATQADVELLQGFKSGKELGCTIRTLRNGKFHRKVMSLLMYLYEHLDKPKYEIEGVEHEQSFDAFRKTMIIHCGFWEHEFVGDRVRAKADSISYAECSQEKIERIYSAVIDKALLLLGDYGTREDIDDMVERLLGYA